MAERVKKREAEVGIGERRENAMELDSFAL
jgi:hypothetical protein